MINPDEFRKLSYEDQKKNSNISEYYIFYAFFDILKSVNDIYISEEKRLEVSSKVEQDFFHRKHRDEKGNITEGIKTFWQLDNFIEHFNKQSDIFRDKMFIEQSNRYYKLSTPERKEKLKKDIYSYSKYNLLTNGGTDFTQRLEALAKLENELYPDGHTEVKETTGLNCPLPTDTVTEIYYFMSKPDKEFIKCSLEDFQRAFSNEKNTIINKIEWCIKNKRGKNAGRGNKKALFKFISLMLNRNPSNKELQKAISIFKDSKGDFFNNKFQRPVSTEIIKDYGFETESIK